MMTQEVKGIGKDRIGGKRKGCEGDRRTGLQRTEGESTRGLGKRQKIKLYFTAVFSEQDLVFIFIVSYSEL